MNPYQMIAQQPSAIKKPAVNPLLQDEEDSVETPDFMSMLKSAAPVRKPAAIAPPERGPSSEDLEALLEHHAALQEQSAAPAPAGKISPENITSYGNAFRATPEWQRQEKGLNSLEALVGLEAQKNANRQSIDLSPLGAYFDYQNALRGKPTQLAKSFQVAPQEDTSLRDLAELQRRRGDMSKGLVDAIKTVAPKEGNSLGKDRLGQASWRLTMGEKHKLFDGSDKAIGSLNTLVRELGDQIPSDLNRLQIQRAMVDMGGMRPALAEVQMESGNQSALNKMNQVWDKFSKGSHLTEKDLQEFWQSARSSLKAIQTDRTKKAQMLRDAAGGYGVSGAQLEKLIHKDYLNYGTSSDLEGMPEQLPKKGKHEAAQSPETPAAPSADEAWERRKAKKS